jgi:uncharacterized protein DUF4124
MTRRERLHARALTGLAALVALFAAASAADAAICKYIDSGGTIHYTNVSPEKGWRKLSCDIAEDGARPANGAKSQATPSSFPRVDASTQKSRDDMRRKVLGDELASEEKLLQEARDAYGNGAPPPLAGEQNDAEKYRQRIARLRQNVQVHERNVEALRKEIATTR